MFRAEGGTDAERYLKSLCDRSFLSLWSYASVFRSQGQKNGGDGKEVCDLLVIFGDDVIIFSDKQCKFPNTGKLHVDWNRWFKKAVSDSAKQTWGAERWIRNFPSNLFLDRGCTKHFPIGLPAPERARFHRIVVAHDVSLRCQEELGGSGTLMLRPSIVGAAHYSGTAETAQPFSVGILDEHKGFVHVLDDASLEILMTTLDTAGDFVAYLRKKEKFILEGRLLFSPGEAELLAEYLARLNSLWEHDFVYDGPTNKISLSEGFWKGFSNSAQRHAQIDANKISYAWDALIEQFARHVLDGSQYFSDHRGIGGAEICLRFMARPNRTCRRMLAQSLIDLINKTKRPSRAVKILPPMFLGDPYYVFLLLTHPPNLSDSDYRLFRIKMLESCCMICRLIEPKALDIVGIGMETEPGQSASEDALYLDGREWTTDLEEEARRRQRETGLLTNIQPYSIAVSEYPQSASILRALTTGKNPRNKPCPCRSGSKFKKCHGGKF